jgi:hypothetical protein
MRLQRAAGGRSLSPNLSPFVEREIGKPFELNKTQETFYLRTPLNLKGNSLDRTRAFPHIVTMNAAKWSANKARRLPLVMTWKARIRRVTPETAPRFAKTLKHRTALTTLRVSHRPHRYALILAHQGWRQEFCELFTEIVGATPQDRGANKYPVGSGAQCRKAEGSVAGRQAIDLAEAGSRSCTRHRRHASQGGRWNP